MLDLKGKAKWDSWESKKGMSVDAAKEAYVAKTEELVAKYSPSSA
jgi:diazepam-binding inhibitor (GABA receptor modulating acyl-CoA-binding protein)